MEEKREKQTPTNTHSLEYQTRKPMQSSISIIPVFHMLFHMLRIDKRWRGRGVNAARGLSRGFHNRGFKRGITITTATAAATVPAPGKGLGGCVEWMWVEVDVDVFF